MVCCPWFLTPIFLAVEFVLLSF
uniref:Uncharacterized protein n=1 Tax=Rhizophora mucronata TaxID=61149 RepID=A0A2P2QV74_RHIMU